MCAGHSLIPQNPNPLCKILKIEPIKLTINKLSYNKELKKYVPYTILIVGLFITIPISVVRYLDYGSNKLIIETERILSERGMSTSTYTLEAPMWYFPYFIQVWAVEPNSGGIMYEQFLYNLITGEVSEGASATLTY